MARTQPGDLAQPDWTCLKCGYSLQGLRVGGKCPECGTIIAPPKSSATRDDHMTDAPIPYLKGMAGGYFLMMAGGIGMIVTAFVARGAIAPWSMIAGTLAAGAWWAGVFVVTQPRRSAVRPYADMIAEWKRTRLTNRVSQALWLLAFVFAACGMFVHQAALAAANLVGPIGNTPAGVMALYSFAALCSFGASLGLVPLCVQLSDLADWAGDTSLGNRLRVAAWGLAFGVPTVTLAPFISMIGILPTTLVAILNILVVLAMLTLVGCSLVFLTCLFSQCSMAFWAVRNSITGRERDIRVAAKKAKRYDDIVSRQMANAPVETPASLALKDDAPPPPPPANFRPQGHYIKPATDAKGYDVADDTP